MENNKKLSDLLPIGSVILLKNAKKKIVIIGIFPVKRMDSGKEVIYDYMGVPYPEGYVGPDSGLLFHHDSIAEIIQPGYTDREREIFIGALQKISEKAEETMMGSAATKEVPH